MTEAFADPAGDPDRTRIPPGRDADPAGDRLERAHTQLRDAVAALTGGPAWQAMLQTAARFHSYSPNNVLLIGAQRPDASCVAGYRTWQSVGRQVRRGETGIVLLAPIRARRTPRDDAAADSALPTGKPGPDAGVSVSADEATERSGRSGRAAAGGFRPVTVFDIAQTDGPDLPTVRPVLLSGDAPPGLWWALAGQVTAAGFHLRRGDCGPANGVTDHVAQTVTVRPDLTPAQAAKTLAHELAHVLLHDPTVRPAGLDRAGAEVEAESVAYVISHAHGLACESYTVPYVAGWAGGDLARLQQTAHRVLSCAKAVLATAPPLDQLDPHSPAGLPAMSRAASAGFTASNPNRTRGPAGQGRQLSEPGRGRTR